MNLNQGKGSMPTASSSTALKSGEFVSDQFPAGLRVLVVDDDPTCLRILEKMLQFCLYDVTKCNRAEIALSKLRDNKNGFDVVISDVHMPDMDGFKLLEHIGLEMDLPVIMMSADEGKDVVMKGVTHGACDYLIKPVRIEALKNIWQHVVRRTKNEWKDLEQSGSVEDGDRLQKNCDEVDYSSSANDGNCKNSKRRKDDEEKAEEREDSSTLKKPRVVWTVELHQQFVAAVNQLGVEKAVPKKILELMNVPGLTRENVASHLQKYRLYLRRLSGVSPHPSNLNNSFMTPQEAMFGPISALNGIDLQALAVAGKLTPQSLASLQASGLGRSSPKSSVISDQRNIFSFENPKLRFGDAQPQHVNSSKPINLLHGIPTTMEAKQLANLSQSVQSHGGMNMQGNIHGGQTNSLLTQMAQPQSSIRQSIRIPGGVLTNNLPPLETSMFNFPMNQKTADFPGNSLPFQTAPAIVSSPSKGPFLEESNLEIKQSGRFVSNYDVFDDLHEQKSRDWNLQHPGLNFNPSHGDLDISSSGLYNQNFANCPRIIQEMNVSATRHENGQIGGQQLNSILFDNSVKVEAETIPDPSCVLFPENFDGDDLMSTLLRQQQENFGPGSTESEYDFDRYSMDNIPV